MSAEDPTVAEFYAAITGGNPMTNPSPTIVQMYEALQAAAGGEAAHPDLATHDALGLARITALHAQDHAARHAVAQPDAIAAATIGAETVGAAATLVTGHETAPDPHTGYLQESAHTEAAHAAMAVLATQAELDVHAAGPHGGSHPDLGTHDGLGLATDAELASSLAGKANTSHGHVDGDIPASIARDAELHAQDHASRHAAAGADPVTPAAIGASELGHTHPGGSEAFPVGSVYVAVVPTNPATFLGYGTWAAFAAGRVLVGIDAGQAEFDTVEETGGAKTHTLTQAEMPAHSHVEQRFPTTTGGSSGFTADTSMSGTPAAVTQTTQSAGGGGAHNNLPPYVVVYMWKRTA